MDKWVELPQSPVNLARVLKELKVTDSRHYAIADSKSDLYGLSNCISADDSLGELNEVARLLQCGRYDRERLETYLISKFPSVQEILVFLECQTQDFI